MTFLPFVRDSKLAPKTDAPPPVPKAAPKENKAKV
jgi:hypothetical protein